MSLPPAQLGRHSPPALDDDAMSEIFLRIPPDDPKSLVRAAAVCASWRRILSDAAFARGYRAFHGAPPMLGFLHNESHERSWGRGMRRHHEECLVSNFDFLSKKTPAAMPQALHAATHSCMLPCTAARLPPGVVAAGATCSAGRLAGWRRDPAASVRGGRQKFFNFVSTASFRPPACHERRDWPVLDSRHGLVLFRTPKRDEDFVVCDLVTYDRWGIVADPECAEITWNWDGKEGEEGVSWNAAVLCAKDPCDHLYCHGGPFLVAIVGSNEGLVVTFASVYSSATEEWSDMISLDEPNVFIEMTEHNAVVGNKSYFPCEGIGSVVEYDMGEQKLSVLDVDAWIDVPFGGLHIWSVEVRPDTTTALARRRIIELAPKVSAYALSDVSVVGFAEGVGVIFLNTKDGLYTIDLRSGRIKNIHREPILGKIMPYMSFYTREWGRLPTSD
ncbi:uncharacterized protein LOC123450764 [Hordeum vulgare subsp. vulgare]|uniref:uncharacterized protein LOC123450764 n=1 Tax=Hordeum vulgare subsp. vulgare TaxID=112509 RepID=UPI001D1A56D1|nr:uncharacterized protein LOC123450764 [Hordeum vulgare subsp. vulgare]